MDRNRRIHPIMAIARQLTHRLAIALIALAALAPASWSWAEDAVSEQSLRSAMTFNFLKFAELPLERMPTLPSVRLCLAVTDPIQASALEALAGRRLWGRELVVVRLAGSPKDCHALYVESRSRWLALSDFVSGPMLTISAYPGFVREGGMVEIVAESGGTRFEINAGAAKRAGVHLSPQLLRLARRVHE